jgi:hypothetical protein
MVINGGGVDADALATIAVAPSPQMESLEQTLQLLFRQLSTYSPG